MGSFDLDNNYSYSRDNEYGYALFSDEIKAQEDCNADILIEQEGKRQVTHTKQNILTITIISWRQR